jgi:hypothetical protein
MYVNTDMDHYIDKVNLHIDPAWTGIAVSVSGGADSALLTYLLCSIISREQLDIEVHVISHIRMWKTRPWQRYDSLRVYQFLEESFPTITFHRHENFIAPDIEYGKIGPSIRDEHGNMKGGDQITVRSHAEYICVTHEINAWFSALTMNPNDATITNGMPDRVHKEQDPSKLIVEQSGVYICHPFLYTTKDWIVKQYQDNNIIHLFDITRSCEGEFEGLDYTNYVPFEHVPVCGTCFWCRERAWAIDQQK